IIYTSHYMEEVEEICTRIAIVDHGKIIADGTKEQLIAAITDMKNITIELKKADPELAVPLKQIAGIRAISVSDDLITISSDLVVDNLGTILKLLIDSGSEIKALEEQAPNLETVFLTLTGRNLR